MEYVTDANGILYCVQCSQAERIYGQQVLLPRDTECDCGHTAGE